MNSVILIISLLLVGKFDISNAQNTYPVSGCKAITDSCDNWCNEQGEKCWHTDTVGGNCFWSWRCHCECTWRDNLVHGAAASAPFEIKAWNGWCLELTVWESHEWAGISECNGADKQQWIYYPSNGAVKSLDSSNGKINCLIAGQYGLNTDIWQDNDCVNWQESQWIFLGDGHIKTDTRWKFLYAGITNKRAYIAPFSDSRDQLFTFPACTWRGTSSGKCGITRLEEIGQESNDELAETAWNLGTTVAGSIPVIGDAVGIFTSIWDPTADDGPSGEQLVNDLRNEINEVVIELKECMDEKIESLEAELKQEKGKGFVLATMRRLASINGAHGQARINDINELFNDFDGWIGPLFQAEYKHHLEYEKMLPIYEAVLPLWAVVSQEMLAIRLSESDCYNYINDAKTAYSGFMAMRNWTHKAFYSILSNNVVPIAADTSKWTECFEEKQEAFINNHIHDVYFYIEAFSDISPNLLKCEADGTFADTDNTIIVYKWKRDSPYDETLSGRPSYFEGSSYYDTGEQYQILDKPSEGTIPYYKKYNVINDDYWLTTNKDTGLDAGYRLVSILGHCFKEPQGEYQFALEGGCYSKKIQ